MNLRNVNRSRGGESRPLAVVDAAKAEVEASTAAAAAAAAAATVASVTNVTTIKQGSVMIISIFIG